MEEGTESMEVLRDGSEQCETLTSQHDLAGASTKTPYSWILWRCFPSLKVPPSDDFSECQADIKPSRTAALRKYCGLVAYKQKTLLSQFQSLEGPRLKSSQIWCPRRGHFLLHIQ